MEGHITNPSIHPVIPPYFTRTDCLIIPYMEGIGHPAIHNWPLIMYLGHKQIRTSRSIIESVDSIGKDSVDMQYMTIQKNLANLNNL